MANSIDFIIGGKDKASAPMAAVEKSMVRLEAGMNRVKSATQNLMAAAGPLLAVFAAVKTVMATVGGVRAANDAFDAQAESIKRLNSALKIRGQQAASAGLQSMAKDLEKLTGVSDNVTLGLANQAQSMGFATDRMDDAAKAAIGLGESLGKDAGAAMSDLKDAIEGNFEAFYRINPEIRFMAGNQQKLAAVMAIANQGLEQQANDTTSVAGSGRRADSALTSLMETIGTIIAPVRVLINAGLQKLSEVLQSVLAPAAEYAQQVLANIGPWMDWVREKVVQGVNVIIGAFTFFETILTNLGSVWDMAVAYAEMSMIAMRETVMHVLTVAIPEYAKWFGQNFVNLIKDAFNAVITVISNAGKIIGDMVYEIFAFLASGGEGGVDGLMRDLGRSASRSLLDGFESSLTALPDIAARQLTQREKDLAEKVGAIGGRLGQEFSDKMSERMLGVGSEMSAELKAATNNINLKSNAAVMTQGVQVTEGRLLTRGPGTRIPDKLDTIINLLRNPVEPKKKPAQERDRNDTKEAIDAMKKAAEEAAKMAKNKLILEMVK